MARGIKYYLGSVKMELGEARAAKEYLKDFLKIEFSNWDSMRVAAVYLLAEAHKELGEFTQAESMLHASIQDLGEPKNADELSSLITLYDTLGFLARSNKEWAKANAYFAKIFEIAEGIGDEEHMGESMWKIGVTEDIKGDHEAAVGYFLKVFEYNAEPWAGRSHDRLGKLYNRLGNRSKAKSHYLQAVELIREDSNPDKDLLPGIYLELGEMSRQERDAPSMRKFYEEAYKLASQFGKDSEKFEATYQMSWMFLFEGRYEEAEKLCRESMTYFESTRNKLILGRAYQILGFKYKWQGSRQQAHDYFQKSASLFREAEESHDLGISLLLLADFENELGGHEAVIAVLTEAAHAFEESSDPDKFREAQHRLGESELAAENWLKAVGYLERTLQVQVAQEDMEFRTKVLQQLEVARRKQGEP